MKQKHPEKTKATNDVLLPDIAEVIHPIKFESINAEDIRKAAIKTKGGAGSSGMDADGRRRILVSNNFGNSSNDLCKAFAEVLKKLCTEKNLSLSLESFLACRLIPLDKNPGLRPIGVGEVLRRIAGKVVVSVVRNGVISSVGSLQVCAGHEAGCEAAIHAMHAIFDEENTEAVLLVDAANAFNSLNRDVFLHNVSIVCPAIAIYVHNSYAIPSRLFVLGGCEIKSVEGTTQGDPIAMAVYAIAIIPLILMILEITADLPENDTKLAAYADDFTAAGNLKSLKYLWDTLCEMGPKFGYYPQASKSWLIVKSHTVHRAKSIFENTDIQITTSGKRHLGAVIGTLSYKNQYMEEKINTWIDEIRVLIKIAKTEPQAAFSCFISGFKHKLTYCMRTIPDISNQLKQLDDIISTEFIPAVSGGITCSDLERKLISLPPKLGGLGLPLFSEISDIEYANSVMLTENLRTKIINQERKYNVDENTKKIKEKIKSSKRSRNQLLLDDIRSKLNNNQLKLNNINREIGASCWLTTLPIKDEGYVLCKQLFWDLIRIRYGWELNRLPENCACGGKFNLQHALSCKKGGFISIRHNQLRNITASLLKTVCHDVRIEPNLQPLTGETFNEITTNYSDGARLDISARAFWISGQKAFFDIRVFNPNAKRYNSQELCKSYEINEKEKKKQYNDRILQVEHGSFTPLVMSANGGMARECQKFYKRLAELIAEKKKQRYSVISSWVKRKISFSLMNSVGLCLRGSRSLADRNDIEMSITNDAMMSEMSSNINF